MDASQFVCDSVGDVRSETNTQTGEVKGVFPALIITCSVFVFSPCSGARVGPDHHSSVILHGHDGGLTHDNKQTGKRADKHPALIIGQHLSCLNSQLHHPPCPSSSETVK